jgi:hypothetical protein
MAETTVEMVAVLASQAIEAAFLLGTSQTSEIISLRHENKILKKAVASIKKDRGMSLGYIAPEDFEMKELRWNNQITERENKIQALKDQLDNENEYKNSKSKSFKEELDRAIEKNKRLGSELAKAQKFGIEIEKLTQSLDKGTEINATLREEIKDEKRKTALLEEKLRSQWKVQEHREIEEFQPAQES